jgi:hypothetical protein
VGTKRSQVDSNAQPLYEGLINSEHSTQGRSTNSICRRRLGPRTCLRAEGLLNQGCEPVGFSSDEPKAAIAQTCRRRWPDVMWVDELTSLLRDTSIHVIVTAAVPDRRADIAVEALRNDKDVVADNPAASRSISSTRLRKLSQSPDDSGPSLSPSALRCAARSKPENSYEKVGSAEWSRP